MPRKKSREEVRTDKVLTTQDLASKQSPRSTKEIPSEQTVFSAPSRKRKGKGTRGKSVEQVRAEKEAWRKEIEEAKKQGELARKRRAEQATEAPIPVVERPVVEDELAVLPPIVAMPDTTEKLEQKEVPVIERTVQEDELFIHPHFVQEEYTNYQPAQEQNSTESDEFDNEDDQTADFGVKHQGMRPKQLMTKAHNRRYSASPLTKAAIPHTPQEQNTQAMRDERKQKGYVTRREWDIGATKTRSSNPRGSGRYKNIDRATIRTMDAMAPNELRIPLEERIDNQDLEHITIEDIFPNETWQSPLDARRVKRAEGRLENIKKYKEGKEAVTEILSVIADFYRKHQDRLEEANTKTVIPRFDSAEQVIQDFLQKLTLRYPEIYRADRFYEEHVSDDDMRSYLEDGLYKGVEHYEERFYLPGEEDLREEIAQVKNQVHNIIKTFMKQTRKERKAT